jgi:DNA primase catalytic core
LASLAITASPVEVASAQRLGTPFKIHDGDVPAFHIEVARRLEELKLAAGRAQGSDVGIDARARVRTEVATEAFEREYGRSPANARELASMVAKLSRPKTTAVAGYDLTFSPVKSVSALWAITDRPTAALIERAHDAAVMDALAFIEAEALYTRVGSQGVRQVDVTGLVAASFTHRDSRAGDPDLHTHVAVANKVRTLDGKWLAIDGRVLFKANVSASETYNTALERHLTEALGIRFADRPAADPRKRPVREIVGISPELNVRWSSRRVSIETRRAVLATDFQRVHGRPPSPIEAIALAQQATLETRDPKHEPRSLDEQRTAWHVQAADVLGSAAAVDRMVSAASFRAGPNGVPVTLTWINECADRVLQNVQHHRATWQVWHLRAEAQRQVRGGDVAAEQVPQVVQTVIDAVIERSVSIATDRDSTRDPDELRRRDGESVYHVAGSDLFTSRAILDAEQRIVAAAGRTDGAVVRDEIVDVTLLECAANGTELNTGQAGLVRSMACSGARVQLAIAAAGTGKTTAMRAFTRAWEDGGGTVLGLAPSAAAAAALGEQTGATTDTLAKLIHSIDHQNSITSTIGRGTMVLVDEAGMADTMSLDHAISFALSRGASVRLIGDDQQLAAIGAGGVLRDIRSQQGCLQLSELMRFEDPAEGAATLALREGMTEAIGYYLDRQRVHAGDLTTQTDDVFTHWSRDRASGLDSIMLAPTRDLVADLNARARAARLAGQTAAGPVVRLADGNDASVGDAVITRNNDRRLRISATDWVKNGDRWTVTAVNNGRMSVRHADHGLIVTLPAEYVTSHTELGYASTVHTAQGISVDTMHGLAVGHETRQQLYTMMSRGRRANHLYLVTGSDGDPHTLIRPETIHPQTATDVLEGILARDESPKSAITTAREAGSPETQLAQAAPRYTDTLHRAAEQLASLDRVHLIEQTAHDLVPGISDEPAWPALRSHLLLIEANGRDSVRELRGAVAERELDGVDDRAAILDWRLDPTGMRSTGTGPLPWLPALPLSIAADPHWGECLTQRFARVQNLAQAVKDAATSETPSPPWAQQGAAHPDVSLLADVAVWRAANGIDPKDRRPTGRRQLQKALAIHQRHLDERITGGRAPALAEWGPSLDLLHPRRDSFTPLLAERLAAISRSGIDAAALLRTAAGEGPLPEDHVAAAIWWRINRHLSPTVAVHAADDSAPIADDLAGLLIDSLGEEAAASTVASPWWPTLVSSIEHAVGRGWAVADLLDLAPLDTHDVDLAQAILWRIAIVTDPPPEDRYGENTPPEHPDDEPLDADPPSPETDAWRALRQVAFERDLLDPLEPTEHEITEQLDRAYQWDHSPVTGPRILQINEMTAKFFEEHLGGSWAHLHLHQRLRQDLAGDTRFRPGFAPPGWTNLVQHLRTRAVSDTEMLAAGVATTASTGRLIDRFRDRAILPVIANRDVLGFVGRRNPDIPDDANAGPKYLNTPDTIAFHKGAQLFGIADQAMTIGSIPVVAEGPIDAIAITVATAGAFIGVAPLGTSLTREQAAQLTSFDTEPIIATDGDLAGRIAAERDYWLLTPHLLDPTYARFPAGQDPAGMLEAHGPTDLLIALQQARPLADELIGERVTNIDESHKRLTEVAQVIAARPARLWDRDLSAVAPATGEDLVFAVDAIIGSARQFITNRHRFSTQHLNALPAVRARLQSNTDAVPADRWAPFARSLDAKLLTQRDWAATAEMLQQIDDSGSDVQAVARGLVAQSPLGEQPARELRYRLVSYLPDASEQLAPQDEPNRHPTDPRRSQPVAPIVTRESTPPR